MARALLELQGASRLQRTLRQAGASVEQLKRPNKAAADIAAMGAKAVVPRRTGRRAASIRTAATTRAGIVRAGYKRIPYAGVIEWGWPARGRRAQPFLERGARETEPEWQQEYFRRLTEVIDEVRGV